MTGESQIGPCSPFFIISDLERSLEHYTQRFGFVCTFEGPEKDPFFAIVNRGSAQIMLKVIGDDVAPLPNPHRHEWARWDAFIFCADPAALAQEFTARDVAFDQPLTTDDDNLFGFAVADPDGYVCFFGRPS